MPSHREILHAIFTDPEVWQGVAVLLLMAAAVVGLLLVGWAGFGPVGS